MKILILVLLLTTSLNCNAGWFFWWFETKPVIQTPIESTTTGDIETTGVTVYKYSDGSTRTIQYNYGNWKVIDTPAPHWWNSTKEDKKDYNYVITGDFDSFCLEIKENLRDPLFWKIFSPIWIMILIMIILIRFNLYNVEFCPQCKQKLTISKFTKDFTCPYCRIELEQN